MTIKCTLTNSFGLNVCVYSRIAGNQGSARSLSQCEIDLPTRRYRSTMHNLRPKTSHSFLEVSITSLSPQKPLMLILLECTMIKCDVSVSNRADHRSIAVSRRMTIHGALLNGITWTSNCMIVWKEPLHVWYKRCIKGDEKLQMVSEIWCKPSSPRSSSGSCHLIVHSSKHLCTQTSKFMVIWYCSRQCFTRYCNKIPQVSHCMWGDRLSSC